MPAATLAKYTLSTGLFRLTADITNPTRKTPLPGFTMAKWKEGTLFEIAKQVVEPGVPEQINEATGEVSPAIDEVFIYTLRICQHRGASVSQPLADSSGVILPDAPAAAVAIITTSTDATSFDNEEATWVTDGTPSEVLGDVLRYASQYMDGAAMHSMMLAIRSDVAARRAAAEEEARKAAAAQAAVQANNPSDATTAATTPADGVAIAVNPSEPGETPEEYKARTGQDMPEPMAVQPPATDDTKPADDTKPERRSGGRRNRERAAS